MKRVVLCEGPSDITALREIAISLFGAKVLRNPPSAGPGGVSRKLLLAIQANEVEITAVERAKSGLPEALATQLLGLPVEDRATDPNALERITVLFDPDDESPEKMYARLAAQVSAEAKAWKLEGKPGDWVARRDASESVALRAVPWRSPGDVVDGLPDYQNLERLICHIAASAYPDQALLARNPVGNPRFTSGARWLSPKLTSPTQQQDSSTRTPPANPMLAPPSSK